MKPNPIPARVRQISDADFWASLRSVPGAKDDDQLRAAIASGRRGDKARAYGELAAYHRRSLAGEWARTRQAAAAAPEPTPRQVEGLRDLLNHKITVWHTHVIQFGPKIDWVPPELIGTSTLSGFHYLFWFSPAVRALMATAESPDPALRLFVADIIEQYYFDARRHRLWRELIAPRVFDPLGAAGKFPILLEAYAALLQTGEVSPRVVEAIAKTFMGFGRALATQLKEGNTSNAFSVGLRTLFQVARIFPEFKESVAWDRHAVRLVEHSARKGFFADGCTPERVWGYGTMSLSGLTDTYRVARRYGGLGKAEPVVRDTIRRVYRFYAQTLGPAPQYLCPSYGDGDLSNYSHLLKAGQEYFPKGTGLDLGVDRTKSYLLEPSGFAILRNGDDERSSYVNLNFGPFGGWHSHQDLLSMNFWALGKPLLEECGRFGPYDNPLDTYFRAPQCHNLVMIDGMIYDARKVRGEDVAWESTPEADYFSAYHRAFDYFVFGREGPKVSFNIMAKVRRTVVMVKDPGYVLVLDSVGDFNHPAMKLAISQYWHSPMPFEVVRPGVVRTQGETACLLAYAHTEGLRRLECSADFAGEEIAGLGHTYDRYRLRARHWLGNTYSGISGFTTLLYPFQKKMPNVSIRPLATTGGGLWQTEAVEITTPRGKDVVILNPERVAGFSCGGKAAPDRALIRLGSGRGTVRVK